MKCTQRKYTSSARSLQLTESAKGLAQVLSQYKPNDDVRLTIKRDGKEQTLNVKLAQRPSSDN